jgi:hypothetical protein
MNSHELTPQHAIDLPKDTAALGAVTVPKQASAGAAANDDAAAADLEHDRNPLWVMAIALGVFCGFAGFVIALG